MTVIPGGPRKRAARPGTAAGEIQSNVCRPFPAAGLQLAAAFSTPRTDTIASSMASWTQFLSSSND